MQTANAFRDGRALRRPGALAIIRAHIPPHSLGGGFDLAPSYEFRGHLDKVPSKA